MLNWCATTGRSEVRRKTASRTPATGELAQLLRTNTFPGRRRPMGPRRKSDHPLSANPPGGNIGPGEHKCNLPNKSHGVLNRKRRATYGNVGGGSGGLRKKMDMPQELDV